MPDYLVKQGDSLASIAYDHGLFWRSVWDHPNNARLKQLRGSSNILKPGDVVFVMDKRHKEESCATDRRHRFSRKGVREKLKVRILDEEPVEEQTDDAAAGATDSESSSSAPRASEAPARYRPRASARYVLEIDGNLSEGVTTPEGFVECSIVPNARHGRLIIEPGTPNEYVVELHVGHLNPLSEVSGVKQRLTSLGFECGEADDRETPELERTLRSFQHKHGLEVTGRSDEPTKQKLRELHIS